MADSKKVVNFTAEQTVELVNAYKLADSTESRKGVVSAYAAKFGKSEASIRMKLVREQVYVKPEVTTKTGEAVIDKEKLADQIAAFIPETLDEASVSSLAKANKKALKAILKVVSELSAFKKQAMETFEDSAEVESDLEPETE